MIYTYKHTPCPHDKDEPCSCAEVNASISAKHDELRAELALQQQYFLLDRVKQQRSANNGRF